eukprot:TRINITY_DN305_c3_g1_i1.p2 TRINITY_DN305_c3_g1~~TRINITY_DN305_c3_g1_i1.p2  ORF type:complete len:239 (+),score=88.89 TRINITY_DN305_c3_g1_i1:89-805(+)
MQQQGDGFADFGQPQPAGELQQQQQPAESRGGISYGGRHPITATFHVILKISAIVVYWILSDSFVTSFIAVVLLLAADFWCTKNVTGRVLVGLRWWNYVREDGESEWVFESLPDRSVVNGFDKKFFWIVLYLNAVVWAACTISAAFKPQWLPLAVLGLALASANAYGYTKCNKDYKKQATAYVTQAALANPELAVQAATMAVGAVSAQAQQQQQPQQQGQQWQDPQPWGQDGGNTMRV